MTLDIAMGGSTNTILHLLAAAQRGRAGLRPARHRPPVAQGAAAVQGGAEHPEVPHGRRAPRRRHLLHPRRTGPWRPAAHRRADRAQPEHGRRHGPVGHHPDPSDEGAHLLQGRPGRHPDPGRLQPEHPLGQPGRRPRRTAASARSNTPTRRKAAWPCCTATSRWTAAW